MVRGCTIAQPQYRVNAVLRYRQTEPHRAVVRMERRLFLFVPCNDGGSPNDLSYL